MNTFLVSFNTEPIPKPDNISPLPPPYEETDSMKKQDVKPVLGAIRRAEAIRAKSSNKSKKNAFLYQVPMPVEIPTLKYASESSIPLLNDKPIVDSKEPTHAKEIIEIVQVQDTMDNNKQSNGFQELFGEQVTKNDKIENKSKEKSMMSKDGKVKSPKIKKVRVLKNPQKKKESIKHDTEVSLKDEEKNMKEKLSKNNNVRAIQFDVDDEIQSMSNQSTIQMLAEFPKQKFKRRNDPTTARENIIAPSSEPPIPMPRKHSLLPENEVISDSIGDEPIIKEINNDNTWDLVAKHRSNTRAIITTQQIVQVHPSPNLENSITSNHDMQLQQRQLDIITKPKTIREMRRQQIDDGLLIIGGGESNDNTSMAMIDRNGELKLNQKRKDEESDTEA